MTETSRYGKNTLFYQEEEKRMEQVKTNVYKKLAKARVLIQKKGLTKSGKNAYAGFEYFELGDFLDKCNEVFDEVGLCAVFRIVTNNSDPYGKPKETAFLNIVNSDEPSEMITFSSDTAEPLQIDRNGQEKKQNPIQVLGSKHTYMRRYLYLEALEISECDEVDATIGKDEPQATKKDRAITKEQSAILQKLCEQNPDRATKRLEHYKVDSIAKLTLVQASEAIKTLKLEAQ